MPAINKILHGNINGLKNFIKKNNGPDYIISAKMDGGSALFDYNDGNMKLYTRGTYDEGQDISLLLKYIKMPTMSVPIDYYIRGELIIKKSVFEKKYSKKYKNARALVAGMYKKFNISNSKYKNKWTISAEDQEIATDIDYIVYEIITTNKEQYSPEKQLIELTKQGFNVVKWEKMTLLDFDKLSQIFDDYSKELDYNIDGLVIYNNNTYVRNLDDKPDHAFAYKKELENLIAYTKVINVEWNVSKNGLLKPIINIEPVNINNTEIRKTTGVNAKFIVDNNIGPGAEVKIIRSGDVIPNVAEVLQTYNETDLPDKKKYNYEWNKSHTDFILVQEEDEINDEMMKKKILFFLETLGIKGISSVYIDKLFDLGYKTIESYLNLKLEDIKHIGNIKSRLYKARKFVKENISEEFLANI
jgi:NAD-dependent DNA ligase